MGSFFVVLSPEGGGLFPRFEKVPEPTDVEELMFTLRHSPLPLSFVRNHIQLRAVSGGQVTNAPVHNCSPECEGESLSLTV